MTVEDPKRPVQSARLAIEYLAAGLSELEITINRQMAREKSEPVAISDAAGNVAQAIQWARQWVDTQEARENDPRGPLSGS
jgi:hypothetical protein